MNDSDTGLTYMQQRYSDPVAGRFLSIDPVTTDANNGGSFNRYAYANNSPYKYVDPDGRLAFLLPLIPYIVGGGTVAVVGHYVLPGRQMREDTARAVGNAILNSGSGDKGNTNQSGTSSGGKSGAKIEGGKQGKHVPGHNNFEPGKSELTHPNPQSLVDDHKGTGQQVGSTPVCEAGSRERVDFGQILACMLIQFLGKEALLRMGSFTRARRVFT